MKWILLQGWGALKSFWSLSKKNFRLILGMENMSDNRQLNKHWLVQIFLIYSNNCQLLCYLSKGTMLEFKFLIFHPLVILKTLWWELLCSLLINGWQISFKLSVYFLFVLCFLLHFGAKLSGAQGLQLALNSHINPDNA